MLLITIQLEVPIARRIVIWMNVHDVGVAWGGQLVSSSVQVHSRRITLAVAVDLVLTVAVDLVLIPTLRFDETEEEKAEGGESSQTTTRLTHRPRE